MDLVTQHVGVHDNEQADQMAGKASMQTVLRLDRSDILCYSCIDRAGGDGKLEWENNPAPVE